MKTGILILFALLLASCNKKEVSVPDSRDPQVQTPNVFVNRCNFDNITLKFNPSGPSYSVVDNPLQKGINRSEKCGKVVTAGGQWELLWSDLLPRKLDFTRNGPVFKIKVLSPRKGANVYFKIEPPQLGGSNPPALEITDVVTTQEGVWEGLVFGVTSLEPESNV